MAKCNYCRHSGILLRTNSHGLCKSCQEEIRSKAEEQREKVKADLISARFLEDPNQKVLHLQRAWEGNNLLLRYEKLGCAWTNPSPRALKEFLEGKLREVEAARRSAQTDAQQFRAVAGTAVEEPTESRPLPRVSEHFGEAVGQGLRDPDGGGARPPGTRRVRRHPAMFGVWMDRATPALTEDISSRGLCVRTPQLLKPGTRVGVTLEVPDGDVAGYGMVRWAHRIEDNEDGTSQAVIGLEFLAPPPELQRYR